MVEIQCDDILPEDMTSFIDSLDTLDDDMRIGLREICSPPPENSESRLAALYESGGSWGGAPRKRKSTQRRKYRRGYATELLTRKKAEMERLRREKQELEEWLLQWRKDVGSEGSYTPRVAGTQQTGQRSQWAVKALEEFQKRRQSERHNRKLKEIAINQLQVVNALQGVLEQDVAIKEGALQAVLQT